MNSTPTFVPFPSDSEWNFQARHLYLVISNRFLQYLTVLEELRPLFIELFSLQTCTTVFRSAFEHYAYFSPLLLLSLHVLLVIWKFCALRTCTAHLGNTNKLSTPFKGDANAFRVEEQRVFGTCVKMIGSWI